MQQRSDDLACYLFAGRAPRESVRVLDERRLSLTSANVVLAIIGSSHFIEVDLGGAVVTEMLASGRPEFEGLPALVRRRGVPNWRDEVRAGGLCYRFEVWRRHCGPAELEAETSRITSPRPDRLSYTFPSGDGGVEAVTTVDWAIEGNELRVETYHTFPGEPSIVLSRSVAVLPERGAAA